MKKCPHEHVQYCPLYAAGHVAGLPTCMGQWDWDGCDVDHGRVDYGQKVAELFRHNPQLVAERAAAEECHEAKYQQQRNRRAAGLH